MCGMWPKSSWLGVYVGGLSRSQSVSVVVFLVSKVTRFRRKGYMAGRCGEQWCVVAFRADGFVVWSLSCEGLPAPYDAPSSRVLQPSIGTGTAASRFGGLARVGVVVGTCVSCASVGRHVLSLVMPLGAAVGLVEGALKCTSKRLGGHGGESSMVGRVGFVFLMVRLASLSACAVA